MIENYFEKDMIENYFEKDVIENIWLKIKWKNESFKIKVDYLTNKKLEDMILEFKIWSFLNRQVTTWKFLNLNINR